MTTIAFRGSRCRAGYLLAALLASQTLLPAAGECAQLPRITQLRYSADSGANIAGTGQYAARQDYVTDNLAGSRTRVQIPGLPERTNLRDFQIDNNGDVLFALDVGVTLGGAYFSSADVIKYSAGVFGKAFDAASAGVPDGVHCDGVARLGATGPLLLSFDHIFAVAGLTIRPADVIAFNGTAFGAKVLDAKTLGLPSTLNVDAIDAIGTTTDLLVAFDTGGSVGGVAFSREDILQLHLADAGWSKRYALSSFSDRWGLAHLDGLAATNDTIFQNDFDKGTP